MKLQHATAALALLTGAATLLPGCAVIRPAALPTDNNNIAAAGTNTAATPPTTAPAAASTKAITSPAAGAAEVDPATLAARRKAAIAQYRQLLQSDIDPAMRNQVVSRLAQLEAEQAKATGNSSPDHAIALYQQLLSSNPEAAGNDQVLYQLAHLYNQAGRSDASLQALTQLLEKYPDSPLAAEARFRRADSNFAAGHYARAQADYAVLAQGSSRFAALARHKLAWCALKLNQPEKALHGFLALLDQHLTAAALSPDHSSYSGNLPASVREMVDDSLRGAAVALALSQGPAAAGQHLSPPRIYEPALYQRLAQLYLARGNRASAGRSYQAFVRANPDAPASGGFALKAADLLADSGDTAGALAAMQTWLLKYGTAAAATAPGAADDAALQKRYWQVLSNLHARAQASQTAADYQAAQQWYQRALARFPEKSNWRYRYADLCFEAGDYHCAATQYHWLAYASKDFAKAPDAAYAEVLSLRKLNSTHQSDTETALLQSISKLLKTYPNHPQRTALQAEGARLALRLKQTDTAQQFARASLAGGTADADAKSQILALAVLAQTSLDAQQWAQAAQAASRWMTLAPNDDDDRAAMLELRARAVYQQGATARSSGDANAAIRYFLSLRKLAPAKLDAPAGLIRANAQYDAAALQIDAQQWGAAAHTLETLRSDFPSYPKALEISRRLAQCYTQLGDKQSAAAELARLASGSQDGEVARAAALQSADLLREAGAADKASASYTRYLERYPQPLAAAQQVRMQLSKLQGSRQHHWLQRILSHSSQTDDLSSRTLAARAALILAEDQRQLFVNASLHGKLAKTLPHKRKLMNAAINAYNRASSFGIAQVSTQASYRSGEMLAQMATELDALPPPAGLEAQQTQAYRQLIAKQTSPLREQARQTWQLSIQQAQAANLQQDPWVLRSQSALAKLASAAATPANATHNATKVPIHAQ